MLNRIVQWASRLFRRLFHRGVVEQPLTLVDVKKDVRNVTQLSEAEYDQHLRAAFGLDNEAHYEHELPPSLCQAGPCEHYLRVIRVKDIAGNLDGSTVEPLLEEVEACYPAPGCELELEATPVLQCTMHKPKDLIPAEAIYSQIAVWRSKTRNS